MSLVISEDAIKTMAGHFKILSGKTVLLVSSEFDFNKVNDSITWAFPENLKTVKDAKCVLASFILPDSTISNTSIQFNGPIQVAGKRNGIVCGFIIFDGDFDQRIISSDAVISEKLLVASNSVGCVGESAIMILDSLELIKNGENVFYSANFTMAGV